MLPFSARRVQLAMLMLLVCSAWLAAEPLRGQDSMIGVSGTATAPAQATEIPTYPISGRVLNTVTHQPIAHVLVDAQQSAALTDNEGRFRLQAQAGSVLQISVRHPGYSADSQEDRHVVLVAPDLPEFTFLLTPDAVISGRVTLSGAEAADGIRVMAYRRALLNGRPQWQLQQQASTNSEGAFRIAGLRSGSYMLYTQMQRDGDAGPEQRAPIYGYPSAYYPGVSDPSAAGILRVTAGQQAQADFNLNRQPFYPVSLRVTNGEVGRGMGLLLRDSAGRMVDVPMRRGAQPGWVQMSVPDGNYYVEGRSGFGRNFRGGNGGDPGAIGQVDFKVAGAPVAGLSLTMLPLHAIPVTVRREFTASAKTDGNPGGFSPASNSRVMNAGIELVLTADDYLGQRSGGRDLQPAPGATDGESFELEAVAPGRYWVSATAFEGYVSSITSGGVNLANEPLIVGAGSTSPPIEITLRNDTGTITGQVAQSSATAMDGAPGTAVARAAEIRQGHVFAIPLFPTAGQVNQGWVEVSGRFSIANLAPGAYRVVAFDHIEEIDFHSPAGLASYGSHGQTVTVEPGATANVELDSILPRNPEHD